jgi:hypothetical protein
MGRCCDTRIRARRPNHVRVEHTKLHSEIFLKFSGLRSIKGTPSDILLAGKYQVGKRCSLTLGTTLSTASPK